MAKGKHATALFEVIHASKHFNAKKAASPRRGGGVSGLLRAAKSWFAGRRTTGSTGAGTTTRTAAAPDSVTQVTDEEAAADPTLRADAASLRARTAASATTRAPAAAHTAAEPVEREEPADDAGPQPVAVDITDPTPQTLDYAPADREAGEEVAVDDHDAAGASPAVGRSGLAVAVDPDRQEVTLRLRYSTAIIAGFALVVALSLAYITGRHTGPRTASGSSLPRSQSTDAAPTDGDADGDAWGNRLDPDDSVTTKPDVIDVQKRKSTRSKKSSGAETRGDDDRSTGGAGKAQRTPGLNYVIIQSYSDAESAKRARDFLIERGVSCNVVKGIPGWGNSSFFVVGTRGFQGKGLSSSREFKAYLETIKEAGKEFARTIGSGGRGFEPTPRKWRAAGE